MTTSTVMSPLLYFSVALGLRAKEMSQLKLQDVMRFDHTLKDEVLLTRSTTKGRKQRLVYLTNKDLRKALLQYLKERGAAGTIALRPDAPLFKSRKGGGFRPRIQALPSVAQAPNERWSTDMCRIWAGKDGWATLALVIDCHFILRIDPNGRLSQFYSPCT